MQKAFQLPKYAVDALGGRQLYEWRGLTGAAPLAADVDYYIDEFEPTASGSFVDVSASLLLNGNADVVRNATVTVVDANSSISVWVRLHGIDQFQNEQVELLRVSAGESAVVGNAIWEKISKVEYKCSGVVTGGLDTIAVGIGDRFGLPHPLGEMTWDATETRWYGDIRRAVSDHLGGAAADALDSANTLFNAEYSSIEFVDDDPDGTSRYLVDMQARKPHEGVLPVRPRATVIVSTN